MAKAAAGPLRRFLDAAEIDARMLGMIGALAIIWIGFDIASGGIFLTPRNLWNLSVQASSIAVMSTGMVLMGLDTPLQNIIVGLVLVVAVWLDIEYRRRLA